ncbi:MAG: amidohydrolase [Kiritimatiellae bacterium]|jgi:predicted amidohydrolase YtcJ|nr:amidohydrolase [Kiritimatiellia bacterium]
MDCPKRAETELFKMISRKYPKFFKAGKRDLDHSQLSPDNTPLLESPLEYNPATTADLVIQNACLGTGADKFIQHIAIVDNIITQVGSAEEIEAVTGPNTQMIDAKNQSVLPGFTDSHLHLAVAMQQLRACNVENVTSIDQFKACISDFAQKCKNESVLYVFGLHYFDDPIIPAATCRHMLDELVSDKPLLVSAHDLHTVWGNTKALEEADLLHTMPPYPLLIEELDMEDKIVLGADNMPSGEFREPEVCYFISGPLEAKFPQTVEEQLEDLECVCHTLASLGITGVHRMALAQPAEDVAILLLLLELEQLGRLPIRVSTSFSSIGDNNMLQDVIRAHKAHNALAKARDKEISAAQLHDILVELLHQAGDARHEKLHKNTDSGITGPHLTKIHDLSAHIRDVVHHTHIRQHAERANPHHHRSMPEFLNDHAKIHCYTVKIFMDGIIEKNTAYRLDKPPTQGIPEFQQHELNALLELADKLGLQVAAHSIGDGSVRAVLDAITKAHTANQAVDKARGHRIPHRIEHIETCNQQDLSRFGEETIVTSMQPLHERPPVTLWHKMVPKKEWNTAFAWEEALQNGAILVFGSDWPIVSCDVRSGIHHAISRKPWFEGARKQAVSLDEAIAAYTSGTAFTEYSSQIKGTIKPGMLADITILSGPVDNLQNEDSNLDILYTICYGKIIYEASPKLAGKR